MVSLAASVGFAAFTAPILWMTPSGEILIDGAPVEKRLVGTAQAAGTPFGTGYDFGGSGALLLADHPRMALTDSFTVQTWLYVRNFPSWQAQVFFRGDDRLGADPYDLKLQNGTVQFGIDAGLYAVSEMPAHTWVKITASYDAINQEIKLWQNDRLMAMCVITARPAAALDPAYTPGLGIGNVQNLQWHNQPLDGTVAGLRVFEGVFSPDDLDP